MNTYCFSDLHGYLKLFHQIKEYVNPEDRLYCLGDCGDRGPDPWDTIKAVVTDPQVFYIKGNHEDMLVKAAREVLYPTDGWENEAQRLLACNNGMDTLVGLMDEDYPSYWVSHLAQLPTHTTYTNTKGQEIFLCHAGCTFWADSKDFPTTHDLLWDRNHIFDTHTLFANKIICHGHTPIRHVAEEIGVPIPDKGALCYANGFKYCIDSGTYNTEKTILLNLDTFESIEFKLKD